MIEENLKLPFPSLPYAVQPTLCFTLLIPIKGETSGLYRFYSLTYNRKHKLHYFQTYLRADKRLLIFVSLLYCTNMGILVDRGFILLLICIGFLALQPEMVSGLRSIDFVLGWDGELLPFVRNARILKAVSLKDLQMNPSLAPALTPSMMFDPNQSNKRKVGKGSDPIHNRC